MANGNKASNFQDQGKLAVPTIKSQRSITDVAIKVEKADNDENMADESKLRDGPILQIIPEDNQNGLNTNEQNQLENEQICSTSNKVLIVNR